MLPDELLCSSLSQFTSGLHLRVLKPLTSFLLLLSLELQRLVRQPLSHGSSIPLVDDHLLMILPLSALFGGPVTTVTKVVVLGVSQALELRIGEAGPALLGIFHCPGVKAAWYWRQVVGTILLGHEFTKLLARVLPYPLVGLSEEEVAIVVVVFDRLGAPGLPGLKSVDVVPAVVGE